MALDEYYDFRRELADALIRDIVGPAEEDETIDDKPLTRYGAGVLYPQNSGNVDPAEDGDPTDEDEATANADPPVALANVRYASSMGMTLVVDTRVAQTVRFEVRSARYILLEDEPDDTPRPRAGPRGVARRERWQRQPLVGEPLLLDVTQPSSAAHDIGIGGLELFCRVRTADDRGATAVTAVLVNRNIGSANQPPNDAEAFFQSVIEATTDVPAGAFVERPASAHGASDEDLRSYRLLYRHAREFATGHGCSVRWETPPGRTDRAQRIATTYAPEYELCLADSNPEIRLRAVEMQFLAQGERDAVLSSLDELCSGYEAWIRDCREEAAADEDLDEQHRETVDKHLEACEVAAARMRSGISVLREGAETNPVWRAFRMMNAAMLRQRGRSVWLKQEKRLPAPSEGTEHQWRPFQLAFILLCLDGIADPARPSRDISDLLWFPTGGGKTEAYLGLIAFTVFLRRLRRGSQGGGVTALMRYTMRLLTIQQFERAALLICACDAIAQDEGLAGGEISIGMWVGLKATPNALSEARNALNKLAKGTELNESNPVQLRSCPWCGATLDYRNYRVDSNPPRLRVACGEASCRYGDGLPVYVVDEDLYRYRPTLVIATVDKFAFLPWREDCAALFNLPRTGQAGLSPPELIIQDELHLISGPLGTLAGLYETAVDALCTENGVRPKVIASTATIRRASEQGHQLFDRDTAQFPPPGIDARNSYFAVEAPRDVKGTRMYVGLLAPGISHTSLLVRAYAALLQGASEIPGSDPARDAYTTLVGYFNSLRVLGGAELQVQDDVNDRIELLANRRGTPPRVIDNRIELTSRVGSSEIPRHLKRMDIALPSPDVLDVILATNMISVGVDVERLGLMAVMGQPQSTSEYIQSTSRVGRKHPGLVTVLFNSGRSRDRSHYESFTAYHSALYRQVESTSVTPFSPRARDRGLHAVLIGLARLLTDEFRPNAGAAKIRNATTRTKLDAALQIIRHRVQSVDPREAAATEAQLQELLHDWRERAEDTALVYSAWKDVTKSLLVAAGEERAGEAWATLWSLRDVDADSNLYLIRDTSEGVTIGG